MGMKLEKMVFRLPVPTRTNKRQGLNLHGYFIQMPKICEDSGLCTLKNLNISSQGNLFYKEKKSIGKGLLLLRFSLCLLSFLFYLMCLFVSLFGVILFGIVCAS